MFDQAFKNIDDALHKESGCSSELDYTEQTSWLLFLKYLDALEQDKESEALLEGKPYTPILLPRYRWSSWAANTATSSCWTPIWRPPRRRACSARPFRIAILTAALPRRT